MKPVRIGCLLFATSLVLSLGAPPAASQTVHYVKHDAAGANSGTSWANAFTSLQSALSAASANQQIWVASGTYYPGAAASSVFTLKADVSLYGGFIGSESAVDARPNGTNTLSILSGDIGVPGSNSDNVQRLILATSADGAVLDGFRITQAFNSNLQGGGLHVTSLITVRHCVFDGNQANEGGAVHGETLSLFDRCIFVNNIANNRGGAVQCYGRPWKGTLQGPTFMNCLFIDNFCGGLGGAMALYHSGQRIVNCTFAGNSATGDGKSIYASNDGDPDIYNSIFWDSGDNGGGIRVKTETGGNVQPTVNVTDSDINGGFVPPVSQGVATRVINQDPLFVAVAAKNFRLQSASPCINTAGTLAEVTLDLDGGTRPVGNGYDMGAYEFGTTVPGSAPAGLTIIAR